MITFRKYLKAYLSPYPIPREHLLSLLKEKDPDIVSAKIARIFSAL